VLKLSDLFFIVYTHVPDRGRDLSMQKRVGSFISFPDAMWQWD